MYHMWELFKEFGVPGLFGMWLGYVLLGKPRRKNGANILDQPPWEAHWAILAGGFVFGTIFWELFKAALKST